MRKIKRYLIFYETKLIRRNLENVDKFKRLKTKEKTIKIIVINNVDFFLILNFSFLKSFSSFFFEGLNLFNKISEEVPGSS